MKLYTHLPYLLLAISALTGACTTEQTGDQPPSDQGGPDSLIGYQWTAEPMVLAGIHLVYSMRFATNTMTVANRCDQTITAEATAPVRYRYTATVPEGARDDASDSGADCFVEVATGSFDFELVDGKLRTTYQGETVQFEPSGPTAGLYGRWTARAPGVATLTWWMGDGMITATSDCDNGLSAEVSVNAEFVNLLTITADASDSVTDDFGLECNASIAASTSSYYFDGGTLVLVANGQSLRFEPR